MKIVNVILATMILAACGQPEDSSSLQDTNTQETFAAEHSNNSGTDFNLTTGHQDLSLDSAYIHVPSNNLYGNRYLIADVKVKNLSFEKNFEIAVNGQWRKAAFADMPAFGGTNGRAYVRWTGNDDGYDRFSVLLHEIIHTSLPWVELKVSQGNAVQYIKFKMKKQDRRHNDVRPFSTTVPAGEVKVTSVAFAADSAFLKIGLDLADLDDRKLIQIECTGCTGADQYKKTLHFISRTEANEKSGIVFENEAGGREQASLYLSLSATRPEDIKSLRITYLAPGYLGTPTLGAQDGVYGKPYVTVIKL